MGQEVNFEKVYFTWCVTVLAALVSLEKQILP